MGLPGILPRIFSPDPIQDLVQLHCAVFAIQYSCACAWLGAGLEVASVVGHSFGQLTALCVAGSVSHHDGLKLIAGRAALVQDKWTLSGGR